MTVPYEISVVIPTLDEDSALAALLKSIRNWPRKPREVIVVDGASRAETRALCERQQAVWLPSVHGRGVQLMKGAAHAKGTTLWFLRADSVPDPQSLGAIAVAVDSGKPLPDLRVDGGAVKNNFLMQLQADILGIPVIRPQVQETTALGAAYLAGLAAGYWSSLDEMRQNWQVDRTFEPAWSADQRESGYAEWKKAIERTRGWVD